MAVAAGYGYTLVVTEHAQVYSFGANPKGQLGIGTREKSNTFKLIENEIDHTPGFNDEHVVMVAAGSRHSACVTEEGSLWTWGHAGHDKLGTAASFNMHTSRLRPDRLVPALFGRSRARMVACGDDFTMLLTVDGRVWNCGQGLHGELGHDDYVSRNHLTMIDPARFGGGLITMIAAGWEHSMAQVAGGGPLYTWGLNLLGQLGHSVDEECVKIPVALPGATFGGVDVASFDGGCEHCMVVTVTGLVYATGWNICGQLGIGHKRPSETFQLVGEANSFQTEGVRMVSCGTNYSLFVTNDDNLWGCGFGCYSVNSLGESNTPAEHVYPTRIPTYPCNLKFKVVVAGNVHSAAITSDGQLYTWGVRVSWTRIGIEHEGGVPTIRNYTGDVSVPQHIHPVAFANSRVGRWHVMTQKRATAFMMNSHIRLASDSALRDMDHEMLRMIIDNACFEPRVDTGSALRRLIGF